FGLFIEKSRVEAGFPSAIHTILKFTPKIKDLYITLYIWASDDVRGLCSGLSLINPRHIIVHDTVANTGVEGKLKRKKLTEQLFSTLLELIPKWDKLVHCFFGTPSRTKPDCEAANFQFPYLVTHQDTYRYGNKTLDARAKALASALAKSQNLETLLVPIDDFFPTILSNSSMKSIHIICSQHLHRLDCYLSYTVLFPSNW
ncbi:hypothetical protein B0H14DRAFT_2347045, partial [Mycena olivaceomarginata]